MKFAEINSSIESIPFIDLGCQYRAYREEILREIEEVCDSVSFILGPKVSELEKTLAAYVGRSFCLACSSGTDALFLALKVLGVGPGDEVIVPAFSFFATAEVVSLLGATPVFVDVLSDSFTMDPEKIEAVFTSRTKAVIPVSLFGQVYRAEEINRIAELNGIPVIEDGAQSFGSIRNGKQSLSFGIAGCTSFFPAKPLGAYGDAGAVFVDDAELYEKLRELGNHGQSERYIHSSIGINGRLDSIQAAVLLVKLRHYQEELELRRNISQRYYCELGDLEYVKLPHIEEENTSVFAQFTVMMDNRQDFMEWLKKRGIPTAIHYPVPLYRQPVYESLGCDQSNYPVTEEICRRVVSLPFSAFLSREDQDRVIHVIREWNEGGL